MKLIGPILLALILVGCSSAEEKRQVIAEDMIRKQMFETLDNYGSYEPVSTIVDTLQSSWMISTELMELARSIVDNENSLDNSREELNSLKSQLNRSARQFYNNLMYSNNLGLHSTANKIEHINQQIKQTEKDISELEYIVEELHSQLSKDLLKWQAPADTYWHVIHRARYAETGQDVQLHTVNFLFDPDMKSIIYQWNEGDEDVCRIQRTVESTLQ